MAKTTVDVLNERITTQRKQFETSKANYQAHATALQNVSNAIEKAQQQQRVEQEKSQLLENEWRHRFRNSGGQMTDDLKVMPLQQISHKELAKEYDGLIAALELDKAQCELAAASSGLVYQDAHRSLLRSYAGYELEKAFANIQPLFRAMALRLHALSLKSHDEQVDDHVNFNATDHKIVSQEVLQKLITGMTNYSVNKEQ